MKKLEVNNTELTFVEKGEGIPVIFVHGSLGDYRSWDFQLEPFSKYFRAISYSRRYHYPNAWTGDGSDYSIALHASDLAAFIKELGITPVHLVASSYGAYTSLYMTSKNPELVRSLVLGEPPILPWLDYIEGGKALKEKFAKNAFLPAKEAFAEGKMEEGVSFFINGVMGEGTFERLSPKAKSMMVDNADEMKAETTAPDYFSPYAFKDAEKIKCPVFLLKGEKSPELFHLITNKLHECLPESEEITIPVASHSMQVANPQFYNSKVTEFLLKTK